MFSERQTSLQSRVSLSGHGVHSGKPATVTLHPAQAHHGIRLLRTGLENGTSALFVARHDQVTSSELCTIVGDPKLGGVSTVEHVMAAFYALGVDNALVEIDGPEMPILDGSSKPFVDAIDRVGLKRLDARRRYLRVLKPVRVEHGAKYSELLPFAEGFRLSVEILFDNPVIGHMTKTVDLSADLFRSDIAAARTFGFLKDVDHLRKAGLALGASLDNTVAIDGISIMNPEGLRFPDEFVRHKLLDAVGDLSLAGVPILGHYRSLSGGHRMNVAVLEALFADASAYEIVEGRSVHPVSAPLAASAARRPLSPAFAYAPARD